MCSLPLGGLNDSLSVCPNCSESPHGLTRMLCAVRNRGSIRDLIHRFKYSGATWICSPLTDLLLHALKRTKALGPIDALVAVPLHPFRKRQRGYNQSELLAQKLSRHLGVPHLTLLRRNRPTSTQTSLNRGKRLQNLKGAFSLRDENIPTGLRLAIVDDVVTTAATINSCAEALTPLQPASIYGLAVARS